MKPPRVISFIAMLLLSMLVACQPPESPARGAQEWTEAQWKMDGNKSLERTCAAEQENMQMMGNLTAAATILAQQYIGQQDIKVDTSNLRYETFSESGSNAQVQVRGIVSTAILSFVQTQQIDDTYTMVFEDGKWKWCGTLGVSSDPFDAIATIFPE